MPPLLPVSRLVTFLIARRRTCTGINSELLPAAPYLTALRTVRDIYPDKFVDLGFAIAKLNSGACKVGVA